MNTGYVDQQEGLLHLRGLVKENIWEGTNSKGSVKVILMKKKEDEESTTCDNYSGESLGSFKTWLSSFRGLEDLGIIHHPVRMGGQHGDPTAITPGNHAGG